MLTKVLYRGLAFFHGLLPAYVAYLVDNEKSIS